MASPRALHVEDLRAGHATVDAKGRVHLGAPAPAKASKAARAAAPATLLAPEARVLPDGTRRAVLPVRVASESNQRGHWTATHARKNRQQGAAGPVLALLGAPPTGDLTVTLTRVYAGRCRPFDSGNREGAFKHVQDQVAAWLGVDDGARSLTWRYREERGAAHGVRVEIAPTRAGEGSHAPR